MTEQANAGGLPVPANSMAMMPPGVLMWVGMYAVLYCVAGGMIAYLYNPD